MYIYSNSIKFFFLEKPSFQYVLSHYLFMGLAAIRD